MCLFCVEIEKQKMNIREVASAYNEIFINKKDEHLYEVVKKISENYDIEEVAKVLGDVLIENKKKEEK